MEKRNQLRRVQQWSFLLIGSLVGVLNPTQSEVIEGAGLGGPPHIGTFEGSTTFTTSSSNGINPGLFIEVMDDYGNLTQYESEEGIITVPNTKEGAYVTQAKLLGKTKYRDLDTNEMLDAWEEGRNLELVSVENPELNTVGKNLFNDYYNMVYGGLTFIVRDGRLFVDGTATDTVDYYLFGGSNGKNPHLYEMFNSLQDGTIWSLSSNLNNKGYIGREINEETDWANNVVMVKKNHKNYRCFIRFNKGETYSNQEIKIQLELSDPTHYTPYQINALTVNKAIELRGTEDIQDELNLVTGELTKRLGEVVLNGSENWHYESGRDKFYTQKNDMLRLKHWSTAMICDKLPVIINHWEDVGYNAITGWYGYSDDSYEGQNWIYISLKGLTKVSELSSYLQQNPLTVYYPLVTELNETVTLDSDYYFEPVMNRDIYVDGSILPLVCSVTIPTESLSFVLNPNEERGKQFIAPEFTVTNNNPTSIYLELKTFEQLTDVLNDVLPETHNDWSQLDKEQSKDIALALVPKPSESWLTINEGPRYVADHSNYYLGEVKAESSVDFTFEAKHGRAFLEAMNPKYRLSFVFDFFDN